MARGGYLVDIRARTVGQPGVVSYALEHLEIAGDTLYYARPILDDGQITYQETWLIARMNTAITRFTFHEHLREGAIDWKVEPDLITINEMLWRVEDGYLDLDVWEGSRYEIEDAGELADALALGNLSVSDAAVILHSLDNICRELRASGCSTQALLKQYAPKLPL